MQRPSRVKRGLTSSRLYDFQSAILCTNKQVNKEARRFLYNDNLFVLVRCPKFIPPEFWTADLDLTLLAAGENEVCYSPSALLIISLQVDLGLDVVSANNLFSAESQFVIAANELPLFCRILKKLDNEGGNDNNEIPRFLSILNLVLRMFPSYQLGVDAFADIGSSSRVS